MGVPRMRRGLLGAALSFGPPGVAITEGVVDVRWWTPGELSASDALFAPPDLPRIVRENDA